MLHVVRAKGFLDAGYHCTNRFVIAVLPSVKYLLEFIVERLCSRPSSKWVLTRFTPPVSGQLEKNAFRKSLIPVRLIRRECVSFICRKLESTSWRPRCGWAMRACKPRTVELEVGLFFNNQALQKVPPEDQSFRDTQSRQVSPDGSRHVLIKCGVDSPGIRSQNRSPQFTPHFIVLGISDFGLNRYAVCGRSRFRIAAGNRAWI
jgi:hypothetical protein